MNRAIEKFNLEGEGLAEFQIICTLLYEEEVQTMKEVTTLLRGKNLAGDMGAYDPRKLDYDNLERVIEKIDYSQAKGDQWSEAGAEYIEAAQ